MIFFCGIPIPNNWISPLTVGRRVAQGKFSAAETFNISDPEKIFPHCMNYIRKNNYNKKNKKNNYIRKNKGYYFTGITCNHLSYHYLHFIHQCQIRCRWNPIKMSIYICARVLAKGECALIPAWLDDWTLLHPALITSLAQRFHLPPLVACQ